MTLSPAALSGSPRALIAQFIEAELLPGALWSIERGGVTVAQECLGWADREARVALRTDHIFRAFSNTKLVTSVCALQLIEEGRLGLDEPLARTLPALDGLRVLRAGARTLDDTEPQREPITIRHLLTHTAGFILGLFDNGTPLYEAYATQGVRTPTTTLADMVEALAGLPLAFQPGSRWEYSMGSDVLARVLEVVCGKTLGEIMKERVFDPLGMVDTGFVVPEAQAHRLCAYYAGASEQDPMASGLTRIDAEPYPGAYLKAMPRQSGGGGLVTTAPDWMRLLRALAAPSPTLLRAGTIADMMRNHLPAHCTMGFPNTGPMPGQGHGLAGAITVSAAPGVSADRVGEFWWGGAAGTQWWIHPGRGEVGVFMTQRRTAFWHPAYGMFREALAREVG